MSAKNNNTVVVWEFKDNSNFWIPYNADVSCQIEQVHRKKLNCFYLKDVNPSLAMYSIDLTTPGSFYQLRADTGTKRPIRQSHYADISCPGRGITWQWLGDHNSSDWCSFSVPIQEEIENAYQTRNNYDKIDLEQFSWQLPYVIDFTTMMQSRKITCRERPVKRIAGKPFQSGLKPVDSSHSSVASSHQRSSYYQAGSLNLQNLAPLVYQAPAPLNNDGSVPNGKSQPSTSSSTGSSFGAKIRSWLSRQSSSSLSSSSMSPNARHNGLVRSASDGSFIVSNGYPTSLNSARDVLEDCSKIVPDPENEGCGICREQLTEASPYDDDATVVSLLKCHHTFHRACLEAMIKNSSSDACLQCPACKTIHGVKIGNQPPGIMKYYVTRYSLAGYKDCDTIAIKYYIDSGIQGPEHPNPGQRFRASGFPRVCYLPNNEKGNKVLHLLCVAWHRRLTFTIGTSVTTGHTDTVTWNEIHHKTEVPFNYSGHGYPDANYLDNVLLELAAHGVTEDDA